MVSSCLGGTAAAVTRYLVDADPITLAVLRWGIGFLCVLPTALFLRVRWPPRSDWPAIAALVEYRIRASNFWHCRLAGDFPIFFSVTEH
jgi:drug/metabolite transporter (DMT)-like permease